MPNAITFRMPAGIAGSLNRLEQCHTEAQTVMPTNPPTAFGLPVVIDATTLQVRPAGAGDTKIDGFNVRAFPAQSGSGVNDPLGVGTPPTVGNIDILKRGYITVKLNGATAAKKGGTVYVRTASASTGKPIGGLEAAADSTNTFALPNSTYFMGPADAAGNTEIAYNI